MKKSYILFMLCLLGVAGCDFSAQKEELPDMQDALLWKISGNDGGNLPSSLVALIYSGSFWIVS